MADPTLKPEKVKVKLEFSASSGRYYVNLDKIGAWILTSGEEVVWTCKNASLQVNFNKNGSPFAQSSFYGAKNTEDCCTGEPLNTSKQAYSYELIVTPDPVIPHGSVANMGPITIDPEVIISPDGPPGGGGGGEDEEPEGTSSAVGSWNRLRRRRRKVARKGASRTPKRGPRGPKKTAKKSAKKSAKKAARKAGRKKARRKR